jgi:hypothetical protein
MTFYDRQGVGGGGEDAALLATGLTHIGQAHSLLINCIMACAKECPLKIPDFRVYKRESVPHRTQEL